MDDFPKDAERALVSRAAEGDRRAVEELLEAHLPNLRAYVRLRAGRAVLSREGESDVVQSICLEILRHSGRFQHPVEGAFRRWLYTTARRKILRKDEFHRAERRDAARETPDAAVEARDEALLACYHAISTPSEHAAAREEVERIEHAFARLSEEHREVILLARVAGLPLADVAEQLGRSPDATKSLLHRALTRLAGLL